MNSQSQTGSEVKALFRELLDLSEQVEHALDERDAKAVLDTIRKRDGIVRQIGAPLRRLLDARANLAGGTSTPNEALAMNQLMSDITGIARRLQHADMRIAERLAAERKRILGEIEKIKHAGALAHDSRPHRYVA